MALLTLPFLAALSLLSWLAYQITIIIYRLYFHPLRAFPGPKLAAATFWYEIYFDVFKPPQGQFMYEIDRMHAVYGPVVRCGPEEIHIKNSEWTDILLTGAGHVRDKWDFTLRANGAPGSIASTRSHALHRVRRAAMNPYFSKAAVTELEQDIRDKVDVLCRRLQECGEGGRVVSLGTALTALTLDVITQYSFDTSFDCLNQPDFAPKWKRLMEGFDMVPISRHFPAIVNALGSLPRAVATSLSENIGKLHELRDTLDAKAGEVWEAEQKALLNGGGDKPQGKAKTIFHGIMRSDLPDLEKSKQRIADEAFIVVVAGAETTARILTVIMSYLLEDPDLFKRLRAELDDKMGQDLPGSIILEGIPLFRAVIQEGVRIASPVTNRPILMAPTEEMKFGEFVIPRGTPTSLSFPDILFDPEIFPDPHSFKPERWLGAQPNEQRLDRYLVTFGRGARSCLGMNLAYAELYLGLAGLVKRLDLQLYDFDRKRDLEIEKDLFVGMPSKESKGLRVRVNARSIKR